MMEELFSKEVISNVPRITLIGQELLHIEQHRGLIEYAPERIVFKASCGEICIDGAELYFALYTAGEAKIKGRIDCVCFESGERTH